ncbi:MAG: DUF3189 family protein [Clostridia bacterium]|nr:DUF3189 family protein [Clostridia bacterium]
MYIFYACYGSAHTSITAASIHLGYLPDDHVPLADEFNKVPFYDQMPPEKIGSPLYMGIDSYRNQIFSIGMKSSRKIVTNSIYSLLNINGVKKNIIIINSLIDLNLFTMTGGFMSRRMNWVLIGRPLTVYGIRKSYRKLVDLVESVKNTVAMHGR